MNCLLPSPISSHPWSVIVYPSSNSLIALSLSLSYLFSIEIDCLDSSDAVGLEEDIDVNMVRFSVHAEVRWSVYGECSLLSYSPSELNIKKKSEERGEGRGERGEGRGERGEGREEDWGSYVFDACIGGIKNSSWMWI